jgi:hypothetical protein
MQPLYVSADKLVAIPKRGEAATDIVGCLRCVRCPQMYNLRIAHPVRADDVETHIQLLQSWIDEECAGGHPTGYFCTDGVQPCI